jgi:hypothetical protein
LSQELNHVEVPLDVEIEGVTAEWLKKVWRPYLRWAQKYGVLFQHSRNNCPDDLFVGRLTGPAAGSDYVSNCEHKVRLIAKGFVTQPQPKILVVDEGEGV